MNTSLNFYLIFSLILKIVHLKEIRIYEFRKNERKIQSIKGCENQC